MELYREVRISKELLGSLQLTQNGYLPYFFLCVMQQLCLYELAQGRRGGGANSMWSSVLVLVKWFFPEAKEVNRGFRINLLRLFI